jgi:hypothetical protein
MPIAITSCIHETKKSLARTPSCHYINLHFRTKELSKASFIFFHWNRRRTNCVCWAWDSVRENEFTVSHEGIKDWDNYLAKAKSFCESCSFAALHAGRVASQKRSCAKHFLGREVSPLHFVYLSKAPKRGSKCKSRAGTTHLEA